MRHYFEGRYYKHQLGGRVLALIPGRAADHAFLQIVTGEGAQILRYPLSEYRSAPLLRLGDSVFHETGLHLNIDRDGVRLRGRIDYRGRTPIAGDIMGPLRYLPMECRHEVVSMRHGLCGELELNGERWDFSGGAGYIEGDAGRSFPDRYLWTQSLDFAQPCSVMAAAARLPFGGLRVWGCIAIVWLGGEEHRLASYRGARIVSRERGRLELRQGGLRLLAEPQEGTAHPLAAPQRGLMSRTIHESPAIPIRYRFWREGELLLDELSPAASFEFVD